MIETPWRTDEYRDAIVSVLSPAEVLVSFADCLSQESSWGEPRWGILVLTNINIRQGTWATQASALDVLYTNRRISAEIGSMKAIGIDDVVTASHSKGVDKSRSASNVVKNTVDYSVGKMVGKQLWPYRYFKYAPAPAGRGEALFLTLTLTSGDLIEVASPFVEFEALVTNIDAAKSGALVVKNTTAAADALDQLVPLLNDGILTQEEFDRAKDGFLGATVEVRESSVGLLRQLHSLHKSGVLSESEFNMKKWDVLSKDE